MSFISKLQSVRELIYADFPPQVKLAELRVVVNFFKGATAFYIVLLMWWYQNFSTGMYLYLGLHGSYGMAWLFKDLIFGDKSFARMATLGSLIGTSGVLTLYWMIGWFIASGLGVQQPSYQRIKLCLISYLLGLTLMLGADMEKTMTLEYKKGIIDTGYFTRTRNPNYLGQVMIYGSFALASGFWGSWIIVMAFWFVLFSTNMILKDYTSFMKKPGFEKYFARSYIFLPRLFSNHVLNVALYIAAAGLIVAKYYGWTYSTSAK